MILAGEPEQWRGLLGNPKRHNYHVAVFTLPFPPSKNSLRVRTRTGIARSKKYTEWLKIAGYMAIAQKQPGITGPYRLSIQAMRPDKRKRDLGNLLEATEDLLKTVGTIDDDCYSEMISLRWVTNGDPFTVRVEPAGIE